MYIQWSVGFKFCNWWASLKLPRLVVILIVLNLLGITTVDDHTLVQQGVGAFLKVFDDIKL